MQVTWSQATSPVLERNITEVVPTSLRLNTVYIEVKQIYETRTTTSVSQCLLPVLTLYWN